MPSRPVQGGSSGTWGAELNAWLDVSLNADGTLGAGQPGATSPTRFVGATSSGAPVSGTFIAGDFVLDKSGAVWVCVTGGTPGTWTCATKSRQQIAASAYGVLSDNGFPYLFTTSTAPTTQTTFGVLLGLKAGDVVTGVKLRNATAAAGTLPTTVRFGIADSTGKILALGGNDNALATWGAGANTHALTAPYTVLADGGYFACFVVNGVWGTTQPTPMRSSNSPAFVADGSNPPPTFAQGGQTDLPAVNSSVTLTSAGATYYMAFY